MFLSTPGVLLDLPRCPECSLVVIGAYWYLDIFSEFLDSYGQNPTDSVTLGCCGTSNCPERLIDVGGTQWLL